MRFDMKKVYYFVMLCLCALGIIGGIGYSVYCGAWYVVVGVVALGYTAWPGVRELFYKLSE